MLSEAIDRITNFVNFPMNIPTPRNRRLRNAIQVLDKIVYGFIEQRRRGEGDRNDLLSRLMSARDPETGEAMDDRQLRDEVMTMFLAGHETTANALTWSWYLLSQHPASRERLEAELLGSLDGKSPGVEDLPKLPFTAMVLKESMRLYPPAWLIARSAAKDDVIGGARIEAGTFVFVCPYMTHRHPAFWEDPERFDPERFAPGKDAERPRFAYFPFGGGPRQCIGKDFALIEAELAIAAVAQRYRLELLPGHPVVAQPMITLRPKHGMQMRVHARS
jgi:cytochrome P450